MKTRILNEDGSWEKSLQTTPPPPAPGRGKTLQWGLVAREAIQLLAQSYGICFREWLEKHFHSCIWVNCCSEYQWHSFSTFQYLSTISILDPSTLNKYRQSSFTKSAVETHPASRLMRASILLALPIAAHFLMSESYSLRDTSNESDLLCTKWENSSWSHKSGMVHFVPPAYTPAHTPTLLSYFIREVIDTTATCLTTTLYAEMFSISIYFSRFFIEW